MSSSEKSTMDIVDNMGNPALLYLNDNSPPIQCYSFGSSTSKSGELVFNTGMVGYPEALTDPSYRGQLLCLTYPLIGNYGVPDMSVTDEMGLPKFFESDEIHISGLIVSNYSSYHHHWSATQSLGDWLDKFNIPGVYGVDTRMLTKRIRNSGRTLLGQIIMVDNVSGSPQRTLPQESYDDPNKRNLVAEVSTKVLRYFGKEDASHTIIAYDCGMKYNIIRYFVREHRVRMIVVPFDYDLQANPERIAWDGLFLSNGPGDPTMCPTTVKSIRYALDCSKPIFGICLGNQLLALASGAATTFKMKYGNRGMNQPCIDLRTGKCYITSQNHGYCVKIDDKSKDWKPLFINANDLTNEGIVHTSKPIFSVQFHPEACGGPFDTAFLFSTFVGYVKSVPQALLLQSPENFVRKTYKKVLLIGSGGLSIGQAGEFDYSGSQCIKALKEEGIGVVLVNPNIATIQTSQEKDDHLCADTVYFLPIKANVIVDIIEKEKPDGVIVSMGGQTALNVGIELYKMGVFEKYGIEVLGTPIPVIEATEDREIFANKLKEIDETIALSYPATNIKEAIIAANKIGYPVLVRAAFALGGLGSGFASNDAELTSLAQKAFTTSNQILIDQDLRGWKELEYEVVRDIHDNCVTVCNMENFDPLGIHTGDSIVVAPSQTLSNREYFMLRSTALKVVRHLGIVGECNIQYALNPTSEKYCIIEVNARLSRSSALASKATGYPLAYVATKLSLGRDLVSIRNSVTRTTTACFEPSLDYCVVKMPRWDLKKFQRVNPTLGSSMLSVGEVMSIGRTFEEAIQKACRMVNPSLPGIEGWDSSLVDKTTSLDEQMKFATDRRLFAVQAAFEDGYTVDKIYQLTKIDKWFLSKLHYIATLRKACLGAKNVDNMLSSANAKERMYTLKRAGFSDVQIASYLNTNEMSIRLIRDSLQVIPCVKQIDTLAAEFPAHTNYLYMTYSGVEDDVQADTPSGLSVKPPQSVVRQDSISTRLTGEEDVHASKEILDERREKGVIVLGCGAYCIGSSVEFDWCAVSCVRQLRRDGFKSIIINYNPETVSTDYDESDRLYFEELTLERVLDIYERENASGVIVSVGGQIPNNLAEPLASNGVHIFGTSARDIERAEDRRQFSNLLDTCHIPQPPWSAVTTDDDAAKFSAKVEYPVLVRPSFVLSGAAMRVASTESQLRNFLSLAAVVAKDKPVVISKYIVNAKEIEFDAVANNGKILNYAIGEHLENAGVHSGDATVILPAQKLYVKTIRQVKRYSAIIAHALRITGPFNIQYMATGNDVQVIECNLRASRTFPFVSKTLNNNFISLATKAMVGMDPDSYRINLLDIEYVCVKAPMFSFTRLRGADPALGVEMASTGEVACFGKDAHEAFFQAMIAANFKIPKLGCGILLSIASDAYRKEFNPAVEMLVKLGYNLYGTAGTCQYYSDIAKMTVVSKPKHEDDIASSALDAIKENKVDLLINISEGTNMRDEITAGYVMRRAAVDFGCSLITNVKCAIKLVECIDRGLTNKFSAKHIDEFHKLPTIGWSS